MNTIQVLQQYPDQLAAIAAALNGSKSASDAAGTARGTVSDAKRAYALATAADEVPTEEARKALQLYLAGEGVKAPAAHGNHFAGYRELLAGGFDIETMNEGRPATDRDAQAAIASDDVKALQAVRKAISGHISGLAKATKETGGTKAAIERLTAFANANGIALERENSTEAKQVQEAVGRMVANG